MTATAYNTISDWSCEYEFGDLSIKVNGVEVGLFYGFAELAEAAVYPGQFYVKTITLRGERVVRKQSTYFPRLAKEEADAVLSRPTEITPARETVLFTAIEEQLYASRDADEYFHSERADR